jgi:hypothetical protein
MNESEEKKSEKENIEENLQENKEKENETKKEEVIEKQNEVKKVEEKEEIKTNVLNSKNEFVSKMNKLMENISSNYNNLISKADQNSNEESLNLLRNMEELQNNIFEANENLNSYLKQNNKNDDIKEEKDQKILKINCNSDIKEIQRKLENINFEKIIIKELSSDSFNEIFKSNENKEYNDIIIKKCNIENFEIKQYFNQINKLKIKRCKILYGANFLSFKKINELYLESINLDNANLNIIIQELKPNINNLKIFSLKNNNITNLNFIFDENIIFNNLEFINLSNNKISKIKESIFNICPIIEAIDLTNNNINFLCRYKNILNICKDKKCIILLAKNPAIIKEKNREEYCNYLKDILPEKLNKKSHIKYLNLEGLFINKTYNILSEIDFSGVDVTNLNSLNLSHNNLNDQDLIKLISNNKSFFAKIKKLILCSNYITEEGINLLINNENEELPKIFSNLRKLDLSGNHIKFNDLNQFKNLIKSFPKLKTLIMKYTSFEKDFNNYLKIKAENKIEENENKENKELSEIDKQFEEIFEKEKFLENNKIKIKMMNSNEYKYLNSIRKYFPYLLFNIKLENKFIEEIK